jgi:hypothetical protein
MEIELIVNAFLVVRQNGLVQRDNRTWQLGLSAPETDLTPRALDVAATFHGDLHYRQMEFKREKTRLSCRTPNSRRANTVR